MNTQLSQIIQNSTFTVQFGRYVYAKVSHIEQWDNHFMVSRDNDEITVVTLEENLKQLALIEKNRDVYALIALNVSIPFYSVGFLAAVSGAIARAGMDILIVSTYSKDYIMIRADLALRVQKILLELGLHQK